MPVLHGRYKYRYIPLRADTVDTRTNNRGTYSTSTVRTRTPIVLPTLVPYKYLGCIVRTRTPELANIQVFIHSFIRISFHTLRVLVLRV